MEVCCICLDEIDNNKELFSYNCKRCSAIIHNTCFMRYRNYNSKKYINVSCPQCRIIIAEFKNHKYDFMVGRIYNIYQILVSLFIFMIVINIMKYYPNNSNSNKTYDIYKINRL
jgi:hypothetical protein